MYRIHLSFSCVPTSLNKKLSSHFQKRSKENKAWDWLIYLETSSIRPEKPLKKAKIKLIRHHYRMLDYDGMVGSFKPVVDALVSARVLSDDSWGVLGAWDCDQKFRSKKDGPLLEIFIEEIPNEEN